MKNITMVLTKDYPTTSAKSLCQLEQDSLELSSNYVRFKVEYWATRHCVTLVAYFKLKTSRAYNLCKKLGFKPIEISKGIDSQKNPTLY